MNLKEALGDWTIDPSPGGSEGPAPLRAGTRWITASGGSLFRKFSFLDNSERNRFVSEVLEFEESSGHFGTMKVTDRTVMLALITDGLRVATELDKEYAHAADLIYKEVIATSAVMS